MSDNPTEKEIPSKAALPEDEQSLLDTALQESDQLLARSLQGDQRRRFRRRLIWSLILVIGGVAMSLILIAIMTGWIAVSVPVTADEDTAWPETTDKQWQERLSAVKQSDPWNVGAEIGMDLVRIPGDRPYKILAANWKRIPSSARKQILKGFTPGMMGNKKMHSRFFDVMHLGMSDPDSGVRSYAAAYIEMQGLPNFERDPKGYVRWRKQNQSRSAPEILKAAKADKTGVEPPQAFEPPGKPKPNSADVVRGWSMFSQGKLHTAERLFRRALKADAENLSALNGLAFCLLNQGNHEQAQPMFEKCLAKEKDAPGPMNGLARCLKAGGKVDEAIAIWERMIALSPGPNAATTGLAQTYLERKEYAKAAKHFKELVDSDPDNAFFRRGLESAEKGLAANE